MTVRGRTATEVIGVCFHGVGVPDSGIDPETAEYFVSRDVFLTILDELAERPEVDLTFDDGYASDVDVALPALAERGLSARFFPLAGRLGTPGHVDTAGVRALADAGMTIGSHGMRHRSWRGMDARAEDEELTQARSVIADAAGAPITSVACPFGDYDRRVLAALRGHGYTQVFTSDRRRARTGDWLQPRYSVRSHDSVATVRHDILTRRPLSEKLRASAAGRVKALR